MLPGKENSNSHGAKPVHQIISMIKWIRTGRLSTKNSLSLNVSEAYQHDVAPDGVSRKRIVLMHLRGRVRCLDALETSNS